MRILKVFIVLSLHMQLSGLSQHSRETQPALTSKEAVIALREAVRKPVRTKDDYAAIFKVARAIDESDAVALLDEIAMDLKDKTTATAGEKLLIDAAFSRLSELSEKTTVRYLRIVPPRSIGGFWSLEAYMGIRGQLGGIQGLFDSYHHAETVFAKAQLFTAIEGAFYGLDRGGVSEERFVFYLEKWYELNRAQLLLDKGYHTTGGPMRSQPVPEGYVEIGIFLAPRDLIEKKR